MEKFNARQYIHLHMFGKWGYLSVEHIVLPWSHTTATFISSINLVRLLFESSGSFEWHLFKLRTNFLKVLL